ncbi:NAD(P)-dependent alcohol dehydrogenase [Amycolatopsis alkalitolerans]|uniref:NAD(P)-dependent alcohol dehydrogenase n=1 Tax=Amycolatopsis alkalitolerans TaxID=2547244 RepID=A0A5C4M2D4_9PSEU|nr:NAD(P)-dependent alcohol dehydrogenase [Amycolatopsis alkalitolerans]TNC25179.1 NAD(P)-dependent alcohol dehydrogenase [Amycolatopsis alkalitolerans]
MSIRTTAAVVEAPGAGFTLSEVDLSEPRPDEVLVRLVAAGLCHTDLGVAAGALPFPLPGVLGHEGAGVVEAVGSAVTRVAPGDQVLLSFTSCGDCAGCRDGHPAYCDTWLQLNLIGGQRPDGTSPVSRDGTPLGGHFFGQSAFARHAVADERSVVKVLPDAPLEVLAPLGCGVMTGVGAVWHVAAPCPGSTLLITGAGAVGLSALMAATHSPAGRVIVVDRIIDRLALATRLGATDVIDTSGTELDKVVEEITCGRGVDAVIETTGNADVLRSAILTLGPRGTAVIVGAPPFGTCVPVDVNFMIPGRTVTGLTLGDAETRTMIPVLADLVLAGRLPIGELITHYPLSEINTAVADVVAGRTIKPVLTF